MPARRKETESLAQGSMTGTTETPGHSSAVTFSIGFITSGRNVSRGPLLPSFPECVTQCLGFSEKQCERE
jgi:hypothetical protein